MNQTDSNHKLDGTDSNIIQQTGHRCIGSGRIKEKVVGDDTEAPLPSQVTQAVCNLEWAMPMTLAHVAYFHCYLVTKSGVCAFQ